MPLEDLKLESCSHPSSSHTHGWVYKYGMSCIKERTSKVKYYDESGQHAQFILTNLSYTIKNMGRVGLCDNSKRTGILK
jgi:hypothetical protein